MSAKTVPLQVSTIRYGAGVITTNLCWRYADVKDQRTQIATAAEEQAAVSNEITKVFQVFGDSAQQSAEGSHEMAKAGRHQAKLARDLSDIARSSEPEKMAGRPAIYRELTVTDGKI